MRPIAWLLVFATGALYALHQDLWLWRRVEPLAFGFLPSALWYHGLYCLAAALLMWTLTRTAWPHHLEHVDRGNDSRRASHATGAGPRGPRERAWKGDRGTKSPEKT